MVQSMWIHQLEEALLMYRRDDMIRIYSHFKERHRSEDFVEQVLVPVLSGIGEKWEKGQVALAQVYIASHLCEVLIDQFLPQGRISARKHPPMAIVTLEDRHVLGKRLVSMNLHTAGFQIKDYGGGISAEELMALARQDQLAFLLISVLTYPSALKIKEISNSLHADIPGIRILVGGAPFRIAKGLWQDVGADACGYTATDDIQILEAWLKEAETA